MKPKVGQQHIERMYVKVNPMIVLENVDIEYKSQEGYIELPFLHFVERLNNTNTGFFL